MVQFELLFQSDQAQEFTKPLLEEFLHTCDEKEALMCVAEKFHATSIAFFVEHSINDVLERSEKARLQVGKFHERLVNR